MYESISDFELQISDKNRRRSKNPKPRNPNSEIFPAYSGGTMPPPRMPGITSVMAPVQRSTRRSAIPP